MLALLASEPAAAELVVSQLIVEFKADAPKAADIEITNNGDERSYVVVEPRQVIHPGMPAEERVSTPDPARLGLLASPARFILEPGQHRTLRIAAVGAPASEERVYRVTVKPVTGDVTGSESGLKVLVGYDLLVLVRPSVVRNSVRFDRSGSNLTVTNNGNTSVELVEGQQCDATGKNCQTLPAKRLYVGASWTQQLPLPTTGEYRVRSADGWSTLKF
jgi:P pilus assembly chaperone PapD